MAASTQTRPARHNRYRAGTGAAQVRLAEAARRRKPDHLGLDRQGVAHTDSRTTVRSLRSRKVNRLKAPGRTAATESLERSRAPVSLTNTDPPYGRTALSGAHRTAERP